MSHWPAPDFVNRPRPVPLLGWMLLAAGAAVLALAVGDVWALREAVAEDTAQVELLERRARSAAVSRPVLATATHPASVTLEAARAMRRAEQSLNQPWGQAFMNLEQATAPGVQWLALEIDGEPSRLRAEGMAPTVDAALAVVDALAVRAGWSDVVLTRLQAADMSGAAGVRTPMPAASSGTGQRFEVSARWGAPAPAALPETHP